MADEFCLSDLISEKEVYARWPGVFAEGELSDLRRAKMITCYKLSNQRVFYLERDLVAYIKRHMEFARANEGEECRGKNESACSSTADTGSVESQTTTGSIDTGSTVEESAAESLLQPNSNRPKPSSSPSSPRHLRLHETRSP